VSCTVRYAPPEAIQAHTAGAELVVEPSLDIWVIGVILFECLSGGHAFHVFGGSEEVYECAEGAKPYAWEVSTVELPEG
jgi:serine/threonine protein kinase